MAQEHKQNRKPSQAHQDDVETDSLSESKVALDDDVDAILAEIDEVLEVNAEEFVKSFIQKGGQ